MELSVDATVAAMLELAELAAEVTERAPLRLAVDATEYAVIGLAVETTECDPLKLAIDAMQ